MVKLSLVFDLQGGGHNHLQILILPYVDVWLFAGCIGKAIYEYR